MTKHLIRWLRWAWNFAAFAIIVCALLNITLRILLPRLAHQHALVESWASHLVGAPVSIGSLESQWRNGQPMLAAHAISVHLEHADGPEILRFEEAHATLDLWASLRKQRWRVGHLTLQGLTLKLVRELDGTVVIEGFPVHKTRFIRWLLAQRGLRVLAADFSLRDAQQRFQPLRATGVNLSIEAGAQTTQITGSATQIDAVAAPVTFRAQIPRRATTALASELRVFGTGLDLAALASTLSPELPTIRALHADALFQITARDLREFRLGFELSNLALAGVHDASDQVPRRYALRGAMSGSAAALDVQIVSFAAPEKAAQPVDWRLHFTRGETANFGMSADSIPLAVLPLCEPWLARSAAASALLASLKPLGELANLRLGLAPHAVGLRYYARGEVQGLTLAERKDSPGLRGVSARFAVNRDGGALSFDDANFALEDARHLAEPLNVSALSGGVSWQTSDDFVATLSGDLAGAVNTLPLHLRGSLTRDPAHSPSAELVASLGTGDLTRLPSLVPLHVIHPHGDGWLRHAFQAGILRSAELVLRGPLASFPFDHGEGVVTAQAVVEDVTLDYAEKWPLAVGLNAEVKLAGRQLAGTVTKAQFFESPLKTAQFGLADLFSHEPVLTVVGTVRANLPDMVRTLRESPLKQDAVAQLTDFTLTDEIDLGLDMRLGLAHGAAHTVLGTLDFAGNALRAARHGLALDDLRGRISFTHDGWSGRQLTAQLGTQQVELAVHGAIGDATGDNEFRLTGSADPAQVLAQLAEHAPKIHAWLAANQRLDAFIGKLVWKALLVTPHQAAGAPQGDKRLVLESNLEGMQITLPWPFGKPALEKRPLRLETTLGSAATQTAQIDYGDAIKVALRQTTGVAGTGALERLEAVFGDGPAPTLEHDGIYVHGDLQALPLGEWTPLIEHSASATSSLPITFDVTVAQLQTLGQEFSNVSFRGHQDAVAWRIHMDSVDALGEITVPFDMTSSPLTLNFERLWLKPVTSGNAKNPVDPRALPNVALACASFKYHTVDLGQAALATARVADGLRLQSLLFQSTAFQVQADGNWSLTAGAHHSQFSIHLKGPELGPVLQHFGYNGRGIKGGNTELDIEASWPGTPGEFTLDKLAGSLGLKVREGRFLDIEPGSGRLFGLLSLQTLPRRLSLDFADLFQKGYAFDRIEGWFELENGNAYTNSLLMEGPSSRVEVTGRTGLAAQDYDQRATVTPALSKSIPMASAIFGPAGIGVGAAIYLGQKMFKGLPAQVDRLLQKHYTIKGSWAHPTVEKL